MACDALAANPRLTLESAFAHSVDGRSLSMKATNFSLHWTGSSRFSLFQWGGHWRLLPASELGR